MAANRTTVTPSSKKSTQYALLSVFAILVIVGAPVDMTTKGWGDSDRALGYEEPQA